MEIKILMNSKQLYLHNIRFPERKYKTIVILLIFSTISLAQKASITKDFVPNGEQKHNDSIPDLIPKYKAGKYGFINQKGKTVIAPEYINVGFFTEDCNLLNSPNEKVRQFGSKNYASVSSSKHDFRIDEKGKKVYQFKKGDLGKCDQTYTTQKYKAYHLRDMFGVIAVNTFKNPENYKHFKKW